MADATSSIIGSTVLDTLTSSTDMAMTSSLSTAATSTSLDAAASSASLSNALAAASSALASASSISASAADFIATATGGSSAKSTTHPASYKIVGIILAVVSGLFIGSSFVFKKKGLLSMQDKPGFVAGEGHAYLKSPMWWTGMTLMVVGEICNFVAYAFTEAILVTPLGALSVVICAILSSIFLKEKLTFFGKIGCGLCILGATIIALNGPAEQTASTIPQFQKLFLSPGFLAYGSVVIVLSLGLIFFVAPKYGKKNMLVYITVCSLIGGLSVSCTSGLGSSILTSINGNNQFKHWFMYFLMGFVVVTLLTEINYLNKALELFNTAMVTPTYYVLFTFATLVTDVILNQGFNASVTDIITVVFGFLTICCGITLLQMSKIDPADLANKVKLDRRTTLLFTAANRARSASDGPEGYQDEKHQNLDLEDPGMDSVRGFVGLAGSVHRAISARKSVASRRKSRLSHVSASAYGNGSRAYGYGEVGDGIEAEEHLADRPWRAGDRPRLQHLTTSGIGADKLTRHQLYDAPMPADAAERISHYSNPRSPGLNSSSGQTQGPRSAGAESTGTGASAAGRSHIVFQDSVIEHRYPAPGDTGDVVHQPHRQLSGDSIPPVQGSYATQGQQYPPPYIPGSSRAPRVTELGQLQTGQAVKQQEILLDGAGTPLPSSALAPHLHVQTPRVAPPVVRAPSQSSSTSNLSTSSATLQRVGTRSFTQMIADHFKADTEPELQATRGPRSPVGRNFLSNLVPHGQSQAGSAGRGYDEEDERRGLVMSGAEMGESRRNVRHGNRDLAQEEGFSNPSSGQMSRSESFESEASNRSSERGSAEGSDIEGFESVRMSEVGPRHRGRDGLGEDVPVRRQ